MSRDFLREVSFFLLLLVLLGLWIMVFAVGQEPGASATEQCRILDIELDAASENTLGNGPYRVAIYMSCPVKYELIVPSEREPKVVVKLPHSTEIPQTVEQDLESQVVRRVWVGSRDGLSTLIELELQSSDFEVTDDTDAEHGEVIELELRRADKKVTRVSEAGFPSL